MGFSYEGIDTGIKLFKYDRRKILDFCIIHDESLSHGCTSQDIEASYALFDTESNFEKFAKYMKAFSTLREMGFELNQIRESLILSGYDQEKALEILAKD
ncbi:hypothetical protein BKA69DRAFT_1124262 [Paraphysoderma sedebokerense]|nr:hypothetical protein BKA69DRAFT_1124262 [Paraphysoderma sedebokerense]